MPVVTRTNDVHVYINVNTLHMSTHGKITGVISLRVGDFYFPERGWSDFLVVILGWWLDEMAKLWHGQQEDEDGVGCLFMDGSFFYGISEYEGSWWLIECVEGIPEGKVMAETKVERSIFIKDVLSCATQVVEACRSRGWKTEAIDKLATTVARVESKTILQPV